MDILYGMSPVLMHVSIVQQTYRDITQVKNNVVLRTFVCWSPFISR